MHSLASTNFRYASAVPTVAKVVAAPVGVVKTLNGGLVKSVHDQQGEYYVNVFAIAFT